MDGEKDIKKSLRFSASTSPSFNGSIDYKERTSFGLSCEILSHVFSINPFIAMTFSDRRDGGLRKRFFRESCVLTSNYAFRAMEMFFFVLSLWSSSRAHKQFNVSAQQGRARCAS
jgi:hypothetical protein